MRKFVHIPALLSILLLGAGCSESITAPLSRVEELKGEVQLSTYEVYIENGSSSGAVWTSTHVRGTDDLLQIKPLQVTVTDTTIASVRRDEIRQSWGRLEGDQPFVHMTEIFTVLSKKVGRTKITFQSPHGDWQVLNVIVWER